MEMIAILFGVSVRSIERWNHDFQAHGHVGPNIVRKTKVTWSEDVIAFVEGYASEYPCFYIEELQQALKVTFPELKSCSASSVLNYCQATYNVEGVVSSLKKYATRFICASVPKGANKALCM
jgi:hypothetical protein